MHREDIYNTLKAGTTKRLMPVFLLFFLLYVSSYSITSAQESDTQSLDQVTLQLKWKHQFQFSGIYAAIEQGYYAAAGLEVTLVEGGPEEYPIDTVLDGKAQYGISDSSLMLRKLQGDPLVLLAPILQHSPYSLVVLEDSDIHTPEQFSGKRIMVAKNELSEYKIMLKSAGVS